MLSLGQSAEIRRVFDVADMRDFERLSGAQAGVHVPEPLIAALFSQLLGMQLPGPGTQYLKQGLDFIAPARPGETLTARVAITRLRSDKRLVDLQAVCLGGDGRLICQGRALVKAPTAKFS
ncbi:hotdog family protein [Pontibaca salina]|uniref:Phosphate acetyltransferase n=1 Tax=Pontibaca salina TaxID=2795731 RepID=A0A934M0G8_9RHOB|nr:phosphate acetyltransferase [Pontibaca salina]MBI6629995.1 phosphate acetyltransferase [Pontibaca salina]